MGVTPVDIGGRLVGPGEPVYVIAEVSANHGQSLDTALRIVEAAAAAGADAVKLQTYTPDSMTLDSDLPPFRIGGGTLWDGRRLHDLYAEAMTPWEWHADLAASAASLGVQLFSSPFSSEAVDFLEALPTGVPAHKIASFELVDLELIAAAAATGKPLIMSTGMASAEEIDDAVATARAAGDGGLVLLRCTSAYPAAPEEMALASLPAMVERWGVPVGLSDHTMSSTAAVAAVALGASVVEKHVTLDRSQPGPDSAFSLEPAELAALVRELRVAQAAVGTSVRFGPAPSEAASLAFRRSLFVVADVAEGELLTRANVRAIRPGHGLAPRHLPAVLGRRAAAPMAAGTPLGWELLA